MSQSPKKRDKSDDTSSGPPPGNKRLRLHMDEPPYLSVIQDCPVNTFKRMATTLLCLNELVQDPRPVSMIQEYYQGILMTDVFDRIKVIVRVIVEQWRDDSRAERLIQEMNGYMQLYSENIEFMYEAMGRLALNRAK
jgi:hypothetical protein